MNAWKRLRLLARDCRGGTAIEYGLIAALVVLAIMAAMQSVADENTEMWAKVETSVTVSMD